MKKQGLGSVLAVVVMLSFGCAKKPVTAMASAPPPTGATAMSPMSGATARPAANPGTGTSQPSSSTSSAARPAPSEFAAVQDLADIHFDFDKHAVRTEDAQILDRNARWLKANGTDLLLIEGHCDERGTEAYNLALGDRRSAAAKNYLVAQGVAATRITVISYGKEHPVCTEHNEACWSKNRRAHFLVKRG
jgi:peptidoglycan-associated lipoprotein